MKIPFLLATALLLGASVASAQSRVHYGLLVKAGLSDYVPPNTVSSAYAEPAFGAGLYAEFPLSSHFFVRPQLGWLQRGFRTNSADQNRLPIRFRFHYVTPDLTVVYRTATKRAVRPFVQAGLRGNWLPAAPRVLETTSTTTNTYRSNPNDYRRIGWGGLLAAGLAWHQLAISVEGNRDFSSFVPTHPIVKVNSYFFWYGVNVAYQLR